MTTSDNQRQPEEHRIALELVELIKASRDSLARANDKAPRQTAVAAYLNTAYKALEDALGCASMDVLTYSNRVPIMIRPEVREALVGHLFLPENKGRGYSQFIQENIAKEQASYAG